MKYLLYALRDNPNTYHIYQCDLPANATVLCRNRSIPLCDDNNAEIVSGGVRATDDVIEIIDGNIKYNGDNNRILVIFSNFMICPECINRLREIHPELLIN